MFLRKLLTTKIWPGCRAKKQSKQNPKPQKCASPGTRTRFEGKKREIIMIEYRYISRNATKNGGDNNVNLSRNNWDSE